MLFEQKRASFWQPWPVTGETWSLCGFSYCRMPGIGAAGAARRIRGQAGLLLSQPGKETGRGEMYATPHSSYVTEEGGKCHVFFNIGVVGETLFVHMICQTKLADVRLRYDAYYSFFLRPVLFASLRFFPLSSLTLSSSVKRPSGFPPLNSPYLFKLCALYWNVKRW